MELLKSSNRGLFRRAALSAAFILLAGHTVVMAETVLLEEDFRRSITPEEYGFFNVVSPSQDVQNAVNRWNRSPNNGGRLQNNPSNATNTILWKSFNGLREANERSYGVRLQAVGDWVELTVGARFFNNASGNGLLFGLFNREVPLLENITADNHALNAGGDPGFVFRQFSSSTTSHLSQAVVRAEGESNPGYELTRSHEVSTSGVTNLNTGGTDIDGVRMSIRIEVTEEGLKVSGSHGGISMNPVLLPGQQSFDANAIFIRAQSSTGGYGYVDYVKVSTSLNSKRAMLSYGFEENRRPETLGFFNVVSSSQDTEDVGRLWSRSSQNGGRIQNSPNSAANTILWKSFPDVYLKRPGDRVVLSISAGFINHLSGNGLTIGLFDRTVPLTRNINAAGDAESGAGDRGYTYRQAAVGGLATVGQAVVRTAAENFSGYELTRSGEVATEGLTPLVGSVATTPGIPVELSLTLTEVGLEVGGVQNGVVLNPAVFPGIESLKVNAIFIRAQSASQGYGYIDYVNLYTESEFGVVVGGQAEAKVVISDHATLTAQFAAEELVAHIRKATDVTLPVYTESQVSAGAAYRIYVGETLAAQNAGIDTSSMVKDEFIISKRGEDLFIVGYEDASYVNLYPENGPFVYDSILPGGYAVESSAPNGTLFGVYSFLQQTLGARWLWPGDYGTYIPDTNELRIDYLLSEHYKPTLGYRVPSWWTLHRKAVQPSFNDPALNNAIEWLRHDEDRIRNYAKGLMLHQGRHRVGASVDRPYIVHVPQHFGWWQRFRNTNPEWFALSQEGVRGGDPGPALCVSNPGLHDFIIEDYWDGGDVLALADSDTRSFCWCSTCLSWDGPQQKSYPEFVLPDFHLRMVSDRYAKFWKIIYERAAAINPDVIVSVFLYWNTFIPPEMPIELHENIRGEFTPWTQETMYYPMTAETDTWMRQQWQAWKNTGISLSYYPNYLHGGHMMPYLSTHQAGEFLRYTAEQGSKGVFFGGFSANWSTQGPMLYTVLRLSAEPSLSVEAVRREYFSAFGPASKWVEHYFDYWESYSEGIAWYRPTIVSAGEDYPDAAFVPARNYLDKARAVVADESNSEYRKRVDYLYAGLEEAELTARFSRSLINRQVPPTGTQAYQGAQKALVDLLNHRRDYGHLGGVNEYRSMQLELSRVPYIELIPKNPDEDRVGNTLGDRWELEHFGVTGVDPDADVDGDGTSNRMEFLAGTDPNDPGSTFRPRMRNHADGLSLDFGARSNRRYHILGSSDLFNWEEIKVMEGQSGPMEYQHDHPDAAPYFLRMGISIPGVGQ